jgi:putative ABC transport system permease protein
MFKTAIRFILFDKPKSIGAIAGTIISVFLIGQQAGIFIFLINAMSSLVGNNLEYVWVVDNKTTNVNALATLDIRIGKELLSIQGVESVHPLVVSPGVARFDNGMSAGITLIGVEVPNYAGGPWNMYSGKKEAIIQDEAVITDYFDQKALGGLLPGQYFEINGKKVFNAAQTKAVRSFGGGLYTFTTIERARFLGNFSVNKSSAYLVKVKNKKDEQAVIDRINAKIFGVKAWRAEDFANQTILTVLKTSGIAISFGTLIFFALIVGVVIIGLTLYSATIDRIKDYGTLKAIGANNTYIRKLILTQALIIGLLGFTFGTIFVELFRNGIAKTGTMFNYPLWLRFVFFGITILIALLGSLFAIKRITKLEPAQVFRG